MNWPKAVLTFGIAGLLTTILTPAGFAVTVGRTLLHLQPVFAPSTPLAAAQDDGSVLYTPHDDTFETAFTIPTREDVEFVQFWTFPSSEGTLLAFEACFYSVIDVPDFEYEFVYYSVSTAGEEAEPGTLREDRDSLVFPITANERSCGLIQFDAQADPGVEIRELLAYLGAKWNGQDYPSVHLLVDTNGPNTTNAWGRKTDFGSDWLPLRLTEPFTAYRNLGIRFLWLGPTIGPDDIFKDDFESGDTSKWSSQEPPP